MAEIKLFSRNGELLSIDDSLHHKILELLHSGDMTFKELHTSVDRAKSTLNLKLGELVSRGLIAETVHPKDKRVKVYNLLARHVGSNTKGTPEMFQQHIAKLDKHVDNPFEFVNAMFRSVWYLLDSFGVDSAQMLSIMGEEVGKQVARRVKSSSQKELMNELSDLYKQHKLGYIKIVNESPLTIHLFDCYQCGNLKEFDRKLCVFDKALLKTIFSEKLGKEHVVHEHKCANEGETYCVYELGGLK